MHKYVEFLYCCICLREQIESKLQTSWPFIPKKILCCVSPTEKAMAPHSSTLAWKISWTEEPGRLQSMGSLRVGHNWVTSLSLFTFMHWRRKWQPSPVFLPGESQGQRNLVGCHLWGRRVGHDWSDLAAVAAVCLPRTREFSNQNTMIKFSVFNILIIILPNVHYLLFCQLSQ